MALTKLGALKIAAAHAGLDLSEYQHRLADGLKRCTKCHKWRPLADFAGDSSRGDGKQTRCRYCDSRRTTPGPTQYERITAREAGLAWCSGCRMWLSDESVRRGKCRPCHNADARKRYASNLHGFRDRRTKRSAQYRRNVEPVPADGREVLLEEFDGRCAYCGAPWETWDHIEPVSKGGQTEPWNIVPACTSCNSSKKDRDVFDWLDATGRPCNPLLADRILLAYLI